MIKFIPYKDRQYSPLDPKSTNKIAKANRYKATNYSPHPFVVDFARDIILIAV